MMANPYTLQSNWGITAEYIRCEKMPRRARKASGLSCFLLQKEPAKVPVEEENNPAFFVGFHHFDRFVPVEDSCR